MQVSTPTDAALAGYHRLLRRRIWLLCLLAVAVVVSVFLDLLAGPSQLRAADVFPVLLDRAAQGPTAVIVWQIRFPAAVLAVLVGAALALAGAEMQTTLDNPLASPFTLGMSSAATFGAALSIVTGIGIPGLPDAWMLPVNAFVCAFASVLLLQSAARSRQAGPETLVLFGIALFFTFNALVAIMQFVASEQALQQLVFWTMGSLERANWNTIQILGAALAVVAPFSMAASWKMTALRLGDERARSFGINVPRLRLYSLLRISVLTATAVAFVGTVAFVGLVGPHIARMVIGEDHRFFLPASALCGALVMSLASLASKTIVPGAVIPIGLVTALIGVPFFVALIVGRRT
jgi:iron complex transport system permease protein